MGKFRRTWSSIYTYTRNLGPTGNTSFVIVALGRSGSTLLTELLNSHPGIRCEQEILRRRRLNPYWYVAGRRQVAAPATFGFKVKVWHLTETHGLTEPASYLSRLHRNGWVFVHLWRRNVLRAALSTLLAEARQRYHVSDRSEQAELLSGAHRLSSEDVVHKMEEILNYRAQESRLMKQIPHHEVIYEDHLLDSNLWQDTANRLFDYLGAEPSLVHSRLKRTVKGRLTNLISNYDEIELRVREAGYGEYVELIV